MSPTRYFVTHVWFWLFELWLRPFDVAEEIKQQQLKNTMVITTAVSGALWGAIAGMVIWLLGGDSNAMWVLAVAVAVAVVAATAVADSVAVAVAVAGAVAGAVGVGGGVGGVGGGVGGGGGVGVVGVGVVVVGVVVGVVGGGGAARGGAVAVATYFVLMAIIGVGLSLWLSVAVSNGIVIVSYALFAILGFFVLLKELNRINLPDLVKNIFIIMWVTLLPITALMLFPHSDSKDIPVWAMSLVLSMLFGLLTGYFTYSEGLIQQLFLRDFKGIASKQSNWLSLVWILFIILAVAAWFFDPETAGLNDKLDTLALFFLCTPPIATGLVFYPVLALISVWQYRHRQIKNFTIEQFQQSAPFRWQTFAYPLPALRSYLVKLAEQQGCKTAFSAIQLLQLRCLQDLAAKNAALELAAKPETALAFCGEVAMQTNAYTLKHLAKCGAVAEAVAVLNRYAQDESEQPLNLISGDAFSELPDSFFKIKMGKTISKFDIVREQNLLARINYAQQQLETCQQVTGIDTLNQLLVEFKQQLQISDFLQLATVSETKERLNTYSADCSPEWLQAGFRVLATLAETLDFIDEYRQYSSVESRRGLLEVKSRQLDELNWQDLPDYWRGIALELTAHWLDIIKQEYKVAREWLRLAIQAPQQHYFLGTQQLQLQLSNPSSVLARHIKIEMQENKAIAWHHASVQLQFIEPQQQNSLTLEFECGAIGDYRIAGAVSAEDVEGHSYQLPFNFKISVGKQGKSYVLPDYSPYVIGEGLSDDRTFIGRNELLHWLQSYWLQPQGKPAIALIGQRRIGKTSLLNKIKRDALPNAQLIPIYINIQGVSGDYDFLTQTAKNMTEQLAIAAPVISEQQPYADFKTFLLSIKPLLQQRRFLLMLDEADLIPTRRLSDQLSGFLRALMQEAQYPVLLLFCGTHALQQMSAEYSSIFFNTVQFRKVSYMTASESADVLSKPSADILEFDPVSLETAYQLSHGQPLLLQNLGAIIIETFNAALFDGEERGNYVSLYDLNQAASVLVERGSAAFEEQWKTDTATHYVLSALAWATDEINRPQLDINGINATLTELGLAIPASDVFRIVERLTDEEIFTRVGETYRFTVPLYRRWVAWRWPPERIRHEAI